VIEPDRPLRNPEAAALEQLIARLEADEREISRLRRRLFDRIDLGADDAHKERLRAQEREVSQQRRDLHARIDALRGERDALYLQGQLNHLSAQVEADPPDAGATMLERTTL
jgi:vacuolar-type H+-ATPase subunit E/Vma4